MKRRTSLRWFVATIVLSVGLLLVIGYSKLAGYYFIRGMDNIIASQMEQVAVKYTKAANNMERAVILRLSDMSVSRQWQAQPATIINTIKSEPQQPSKLYKALEKEGWSAPPDTCLLYTSDAADE